MEENKKQSPFMGDFEPLERPVLPWLKSTTDRVPSLDTSDLHLVKRNPPDPNIKRKQRWTKHKVWLLLSNTVVKQR
jgi:hypothetical protein